jgi:hypothetical protein
MSKKEFKRILQSNKAEDKSKKPANFEDDITSIANLKMIRSMVQSSVHTLSTSRAVDMLEDAVTYILQLQEMIKVFRQVCNMEDLGEGREIPKELSDQYNKIMGYPEHQNKNISTPPGEMLSQEEIDSLLAPPTPDSASMPLTDYMMLSNEDRQVTVEERVSTEIILESFELESLRDMLYYSHYSIVMGPDANEREILIGLISNNPSILERWLHAGSPRHE